MCGPVDRVRGAFRRHPRPADRLAIAGRLPLFPVLVATFALTLLIGWHAPEVRFRQPDGTCRARPILWRALAIAMVLLLLTAALWPTLLFRLPRERPRVWFMVVTLYPLLSVMRSPKGAES